MKCAAGERLKLFDAVEGYANQSLGTHCSLAQKTFIMGGGGEERFPSGP